MRKSLRIAIYLSCVSFLAVIVILVCRIETIIDLFHQINIDEEFFSNLFLGIGTNGLFAAIGFWIDYFDKKAKIKEELVVLYKAIRSKCFKRILFEANSYENDSDEVTKIYDFLYANGKTLRDYRPPMLLLRVKVAKFLKKRKNTPSCRKFFNKYASEDPYALICVLCVELLTYFTYLNSMQLSLTEYAKEISFCEARFFNIAESDIDEENCAQELHKLFRKQLISYKIDKRDLYAKFYAIDAQLSERNNSYDNIIYIVPEERIVEDK